MATSLKSRPFEMEVRLRCIGENEAHGLIQALKGADLRHAGMPPKGTGRPTVAPTIWGRLANAPAARVDSIYYGYYISAFSNPE